LEGWCESAVTLYQQSFAREKPPTRRANAKKIIRPDNTKKEASYA